MVKSEYEIGKYVDGKIMIDEKFIGINNSKKCSAKEICNLGNQMLPSKVSGKPKILEPTSKKTTKSK